MSGRTWATGADRLGTIAVNGAGTTETAGTNSARLRPWFTAPACHVGMGQWQATRSDAPAVAVETLRWAQQAGRWDLADSARAMGHR